MRSEAPEEGLGVTDQSEQPWEAVFERDGRRVSKSPWGPEDEIGRVNWMKNRVRQVFHDGHHSAYRNSLGLSNV